MIYTSYFGKLRSLPDNIIPVSICIGIPKWHKGLQYRKLSPSYDLLMEWKKNHNEDDYRKRFKEEVLDKLNPLKVVNELQIMIPNEIKEAMQSPIHVNEDVDVVLVCYEKSSDFCHRHLVADWLRDNGFKCEEWEEK